MKQVYRLGNIYILYVSFNKILNLVIVALVSCWQALTGHVKDAAILQADTNVLGNRRRPVCAGGTASRSHCWRHHISRTVLPIIP
jgi:hypothetical protein